MNTLQDGGLDQDTVTKEGKGAPMTR
ncbi:hypothetical protein EYZ11_008120 [Aspergillus tanneri]|uniref:Uncharacterized protein n=1 Tax=Aspergillus tanneri TaxID=1220188 RepID=A0A4S3JBF5_9EURO|nr:hypothetical protein EYZ11_008120 [Aspergillus tanneri]